MVAPITHETIPGTDPFFEKNAYYVEEHRGSAKGRNEFGIWDENGGRLGTLVQRVSLSGKFLRIFLKSSLLPFKLEFIDRNGSSIAGIRRGWTVFVSRTEVFDGRGNVVGFLKHKYRSRKPRLKVFNNEGRKIGEITGTSGAWDMSLIDRDYHPFGHIAQIDSRAAPGEVRGKTGYFISFSRPALIPSDRRVMLVSAIAIDRLLISNG
jgi:hypothetical protein